MKRVITYYQLKDVNDMSVGEEFTYIDKKGKSHNLRVEKDRTKGVTVKCSDCALFNRMECFRAKCRSHERENKGSIYFVEEAKTQ